MLRVTVVESKVDFSTRELVTVERPPLNMDADSVNKLIIDSKGYMTVMLEVISNSEIKVHFRPKKEFFVRLNKAYDKFVHQLFLQKGVDPREQFVSKVRYQAILKGIQDEFALEEGDPDMGEWIMMLVMNSPQFYTEDVSK